MYPGVCANEAQRFSAKPRQLRGEARGWGAPFSARRGPLGAQDPALNAPHRPQPTTRGLGFGSEAGQSSAKSSTSVFAPVSGCLGGGARAWKNLTNGTKYKFTESTGTYISSAIMSELVDKYQFQYKVGILIF